MSPLLISLLLAAGVCSLSAETFDGFNAYCYSDGKRYTFTITAQQQATCPKWDPEREDHPPLSPARAMSLSKEFIATIQPLEGHAWGFDELSLIDEGGWFWRVRYRLMFRGYPTDGEPVTMDCYILMDGTVIKPQVKLHRLGAD